MESSLRGAPKKKGGKRIEASFRKKREKMKKRVPERRRNKEAETERNRGASKRKRGKRKKRSRNREKQGRSKREKRGERSNILSHNQEIRERGGELHEQTPEESTVRRWI